MLFSVLMSLYDKENPQYLYETLKSLYKQSLKPNEIIIVYDGVINYPLSSVVELWKTKLNIKIVSLSENVGLGKALNIGLKYCNNNIVARMDTDDVCELNRFERQINYMQDHPIVCVLGSNISEYDNTLLHFIDNRNVPILHEEIIREIIKRNPFNHMSIVFRKDIVEKVGGYKHHNYMEDYNLWLRIVANGYRVENIDAYLLKVRAGDEMLSRRRGLKYILSEIKLAKLKYSLGFQNIFSAVLVFFIRSIPRILPIFFLKITYRLVRKIRGH